MGRTINSTKLTKRYILENVSQETIFATYLNLNIDTIKYCINTGELIISPLRWDRHPTCGFRYNSKGMLKFRDFAGYIWGDCFDIVALVISTIYNRNIQVNNKQDFITVLRHITFTFKDIFYGEARDENLIKSIDTAIISIKKQKPVIDIVTRQWNEDDARYWKQFGVTLQFLNINFVYPVEQFYINKNVNPEPKYYYSYSDPCYAYYLGKDRNDINSFKLYFPLRDKSHHARFITNSNHLEGIHNLNKKNYDYIILTKSSKDRLSIGCAINSINSLYGGVNVSIGVINVPHETYRLRDYEYNWLNNKLNVNGRIISLMDNDRTGIAEAIWLRNTYNIQPLLIPYDSGCKDFAEYYNKFGIKYVYDKITDLINNKNYGTKKIDFGKVQENSALPF